MFLRFGTLFGIVVCVIISIVNAEEVVQGADDMDVLPTITIRKACKIMVKAFTDYRKKFSSLEEALILCTDVCFKENDDEYGVAQCLKKYFNTGINESTQL
ncbi:hypothetical protein TSAR_016075 [Trichomalopsis sarcophagae]|uniref:Uncharacterized protein n=1 Tax=Trichomalopsis sarcophagae TaxID=543379 RepID=A0A232F0H6_9HYME|nr:hypothetical protein TSAR_016075 [Trichomalopsis sarcophagae]